MAKIAITWVKSGIKYKFDQKDTLESLGLKRMNQTVVQEDNQAIRGMIQKVRHLVAVSEAE
ncbi:50S ribosomal protein L30 [Dehalogenimonas sp. 4OHTPN]|uniref:Large ribosomal subunit protein uL30 n=1 Tax=Dehalogenimonas sp. 4OHTPN TaxID=3166643 RepID=A0AAU8G9T7_9CHLR